MSASTDDSQKRPNFLIIVADDLGFSDLGCFGGEIRTPNLDKLASHGVRFTDFHTASACSPTRSMLLSGTDNHIAGVGVMSEQRGWDLERWNKRGHEGYLNFDVAPLPELLQASDYHTLLSGKWHLGLRDDTNPHARGFDRSFALLPGCHNHYGWEPQLDVRSSFFERIPPLYTEDGVRVDMKPNTTNEYDQGFYSTTAYSSKLIHYLSTRSPTDRAKPFFAFLPFAAPHWPLQCSPADRAPYKGVYDQGPEHLRQQRLARLKELGIVGRDVVPHDVVAPGFSEWEQMTDEERALSARSMEAYAGMVARIDAECGRVFDHLKQTGEFDNTLIVFMSDNGAEGAAVEAHPILGPNIIDVVSRLYDNSLDNVGNHNSFVWYGPRWAQASTAPGRLYKMFSTEGGIRVPFILHYPPLTSAPDRAGTLCHAFSTVMDLAPTILSLASVTHPAPNPPAMGTWKGHEVYPMRGKSWLPYLSSPSADLSFPAGIHTDDDPATGWEMYGRAALRKGKYKIVYMPVDAHGKGRWELFDIERDPGEVDDLAERKEFEQKVEELVGEYERYVRETGVVWGKAFDDSKIGEWYHLPEDSVGGDPLGETKAWMTKRSVPLKDV